VEADRVKEQRLDEADRAQADLFNLLKTLSAPVAIVDENLYITRVSPGAESPLFLHPGIQGQPLRVLQGQLPGVDLEALARRVMEVGSEVEREVQDAAGRWYLLRIHPYLGSDRRLTGTVLALLQVDARQHGDEHYDPAGRYTQAVIDILPLPVLILETNFLVASVNEAFCGAAGLPREEIEDRFFHRLQGGAWEIPQLRKNLEDLTVQGGVLKGLWITEGLRGLGIGAMKVSACRLEEGAGHSPRLLLAIEERREEKGEG